MDRRGDQEYEIVPRAFAVNIRVPYSSVRTGDCAAVALLKADANCTLLNFEDSTPAARSSKFDGTAVTLLKALGRNRKLSCVLRSPVTEELKLHLGARARLK